MKKTFIVFGLCAILLSMPVLCAMPTVKTSSLLTNPPGDSDGTFVGAMGRLYREQGEWQFDDVYAYMGGVYWLGLYKKIYGVINNLDNEQIGTIGAYLRSRIIVGYIQNMQGQRAPIIGFLFSNQNNFFAGRIMSVIGPAPHIWGFFTPNT